jgi:hypothetical protein
MEENHSFSLLPIYWNIHHTWLKYVIHIIDKETEEQYVFLPVLCSAMFSSPKYESQANLKIWVLLHLISSRLTCTWENV